ncbi:MAG: hypothetical protein VKO44_04745 [Cyanobacteriota bacterium]|nr:hypothetical protein [Cyanobacteriota bacterium]
MGWAQPDRQPTASPSRRQPGLATLQGLAINQRKEGLLPCGWSRQIKAHHHTLAQQKLEFGELEKQKRTPLSKLTRS